MKILSPRRPLLRIPTALARILSLASIVVLLLLIAHYHWTPLITALPNYFQKAAEANPSLHILIPATTSNAELCKCVLSTYILDYPTPTLINWEDAAATSNANWSFGGSHIAKITGTLRYLDREHVAEEDLILILDGFDTWMQLPPPLLMSRYQRINTDADERLVKRMGRGTVKAEHMRQTILFPAEKVGPYPDRWDEPSTYALPDTPIRMDLYGVGTDGVMHEGDEPVISLVRDKLRPRWLNSGLMFGPSEDMRRLFDAANSRVDTMKHKGSDQAIFAELFGEQSFERDVKRMQHRSSLLKALVWLKEAMGLRKKSTKKHDPDEPDPALIVWDGGETASEYHVGLDYYLEISFTNTASEDDAMFLTYGSASPSLEDQQRLGVNAPDPPRVTALPDDILNSQLPFHALLADDQYSTDDLANMQWGELPLLTNIWTETVPVTFHINGNKDLRQLQWSNMWYFPRLRQLIDARQKRPGEPSPGAFNDSGNFLDIEQLCPDIEDEVFRDPGPWIYYS